MRFKLPPFSATTPQYWRLEREGSCGRCRADFVLKIIVSLGFFSGFFVKIRNGVLHRWSHFKNGFSSASIQVPRLKELSFPTGHPAK
jgi:hypothetical protein